MNNQENASASLSYRDAGVDIDAGNRLVEAIKPIAKSTRRPGCVDGLGGFGALFELPLDRYRQPLLVSGTDGVGTKLKLAIDLQRHDTIGIDLVAMCVNDLLVQGAEPLFFLDYYATASLDVATARSVITGIGEGCRQAGAALIGGETAEMPGLYSQGDYDLAGFCVGIVERDELIDGSQVAAGDAMLAIASSGPHSNGYSLIRKIVEHSGADLAANFIGRDGQPSLTTLGDALLAPTRIYTRALLPLFQKLPVHALAHITGGGLLENLPRVLPDHVSAEIDPWPLPDIFCWLQSAGNVDDHEMRRTFNCGIGMVVCLPEEHCQAALQQLGDAGERAWKLGRIVPREAGREAVCFG